MGIAEAHAEQAALRKGVIGADDVVAGTVAPLPVVPRVQEHEAPGAVAGAEDGDETADHAHGEHGGDDLARDAPHPHDGDDTHSADDRGAQVGLGAVHDGDGHDEEDEHPHHGGAEFHHTAAVVQKQPHGHEQEGDLAEL